MFYCDLSKTRNEVLLFMHTQNNAVTEPRRPLAVAKLAAAARLSPDSPGQNLCPSSVIDIKRERMETTHQNNMARSSTFNLAFKSSSVASEELTIEGVSVDVVSIRRSSKLQRGWEITLFSCHLLCSILSCILLAFSPINIF